MLAALLAVALGVVYAEFVGYWVHRLIHSGKIEWLAKVHMEHHLREYGPRMPMRTEGYKSPNTIKIANIGLEWLIPIALVTTVTVTASLLLGFSLLTTAIFMASGIGWGIFLFNYMHDLLHLKNTWVLNTSLRKWFIGVRRLHDIHHIQLTDEGRMDVNFGICFFGMDKLFGTHQKTTYGFNYKGLEAAKKTYSHIYDASSSQKTI